MTKFPDAAGVLVASRDELVAIQRQLPTGDPERMNANALLGDAAAMCIEADIALVAYLAAARPEESADVIIARHRRRWKGRLIGWGLVGPLTIVGLVLLVVVIAALFTAFIWRP